MNTTHRHSPSDKPVVHRPAAARDGRRLADLARIKRALLEDYAQRAGEHQKLLRLALNEAEALAWSTGFPHLFFPTLANEKAEAALAWHRRQRAVRRTAIELAFAE